RDRAAAVALGPAPGGRRRLPQRGRAVRHPGGRRPVAGRAAGRVGRHVGWPLGARGRRRGGCWREPRRHAGPRAGRGVGVLGRARARGGARAPATRPGDVRRTGVAGRGRRRRREAGPRARRVRVVAPRDRRVAARGRGRVAPDGALAVGVSGPPRPPAPPAFPAPPPPPPREAVGPLTSSRLKWTSFAHSCIYLSLLVSAFALGKPEPATFALGLTHGLLWIFMSLACIA